MNDDARATAVILLICREGQCRNHYQKELETTGVAIVFVLTLLDFFKPGTYCPLNGVFVDMPTYMRFSDEEKLLLTELAAIFPTLRLNCNESTGVIRTLPFGHAYPGNFPPSGFVEQYCIPFAQRRVRACERVVSHVPALLSRELPVENGSETRCVTANVSNWGCFLISYEPWCVASQGWLVLTELADPAPIRVEVCWARIWGKHQTLPGMGVKFLDLRNHRIAN